MNLETPQPEISVSQALSRIEATRGQIMQMGANDSENGGMDLIVAKLLKGEITPEKAIEQAQAIMDNKQSYH